jgi:hypothetical protein
MEDKKDKTGPKGPRNTVKQIISIEGHPECLFETKKREHVKITILGETIKLGSVGAHKQKILNKLNGLLSGVTVSEYIKPYRRAVKVPRAVTVKTTPTSTQITFAAPDDMGLAKRINEFADRMAKNKEGTLAIARCKWQCTIDLKKPIAPTTDNSIPTPTPIPKKELSEKTQSLHLIAHRVMAEYKRASKGESHPLRNE